MFRTDKTVMFNNCGINCNNSSATTSIYIVRRTARSQRSDSKIGSYQPKRIDNDFEDNLYDFLFHAAKKKIKFEIAKYVNTN